MIRVLFVCLGNICRSPLAEALFKSKTGNQSDQQKYAVDSAGTSDYHIGELPDERTIACAKRHQISIKHRGRQVNRRDFRDFNYIVAMDEQNLRDLNEMKVRYGYPEKDIFLMRSFQANPKSLSVPDPYYGGQDGFENVFEILDESIDGFLTQITSTQSQHV